MLLKISQVIKWNQVNATKNTRTGYFTDSEGAVVQVEQSNNTKFLALNSLIKMTPGGYHFMKNGSLMATGPDITYPGATDNKWTSITQIKNAGLGDGNTAGKNLDGNGAITLNEVLPTGAVVDKVHPNG